MLVLPRGGSDRPSLAAAVPGQRSRIAFRSVSDAPASESCSALPPSWPVWSAPASCPRASSSRRRCAGSTSSSPTINAFTHVAHESALAAADAIGRRGSRPVRRRADRDQGQPGGRGDAADDGQRPVRRVRPRPRRVLRPAPARGGVRDRRQDLAAGDGDPADDRAAAVRRTATPWDADRTPGGSSGGAAAAVAAGMVPVAHGNDGGGSIRIPASCCGLVGLKPARGRVSVGPDGGQSFLVSDGVLTRSVGDTATVLDVLAGAELGDATWAPPPPTAYGALARVDPGRLRIGLATAPPYEGATVDPVCSQAAHDAAALLESLGHDVEEIVPPWSGLEPAPRLHPCVRAADLAHDVGGRADRRARADRRRRRAAHLGALGADPRARTRSSI